MSLMKRSTPEPQCERCSTDDTDLAGAVLDTENGGTVECAIGSIAMKAGFADMKQLGTDGWVVC